MSTQRAASADAARPRVEPTFAAGSGEGRTAYASDDMSINMRRGLITPEMPEPAATPPSLAVGEEQAPARRPRAKRGFRPRRSPRRVPHRVPTEEELAVIEAHRPVIETSRSGLLSYGFHSTWCKIQVANTQDFVFSHAIPVLEEYNAQSFEHSIDPLRIEALSLAPTLFYAWDSTTAVHLLVQHNLFVRVQLKLEFGSDFDWRNATVRDGDRWITLHDFVRTLPPPSIPTLRWAGYKLQYDWYRHILQKPFRFLDLPVEIQRQILLHSMGERVVPMQSANEFKLNAGFQHVPYVHDLDTTFTRRIPQTNKAVLQLSRTLRQLAGSVLREDTIKTYYAMAHLLNMPTQFHPNMVRIELCFTAFDYINFFHADIPPFKDWSSDATAPAAFLKSLPNLKELGIYFRSTVSLDNSPWSQATHRALVDCSRTPCQKDLVDWIMSFAAPHLLKCGIQRVFLTGYVKNSSKEKWEKLLNDKSAIDYTALLVSEQEAIRVIDHVALPPKCLCKPSCEYDGVNRLRRKDEEECGCPYWRRCRCWERLPDEADYRYAYDAYTFAYEDRVQEVVDGESEKAGTGVEGMDAGGNGRGA